VAEGGVRETVMDGVNGLLVEHSLPSLIEAITRLRDDPTYARSLGRNGRELIHQKWSLDVSIERLESKIFEVLQGEESCKHDGYRY